MAILGATGPTGRHLAPILQERNQQVRAISRSESNLGKCFPDDAIEKVAADATDEVETVRALDGCDVVYDCIGLPVDRIAQHPVTARNIAKAIQKTGARCVQISSYWAYLPIVKLPLTEEHPRTDGPGWARYRREAEDILQEAFVRVWKNASRWDQNRNTRFTTWFYRIVMNLCIDVKRKRKPVSELVEAFEMKSTGLLPDAQLSDKQMAAKIAVALKLLPERQKIAMTLCYLQGLGNKEAAEILDISIGAIESLLVRGRAKMAELLKEHKEEFLKEII